MTRRIDHSTPTRPADTCAIVARRCGRRPRLRAWAGLIREQVLERDMVTLFRIQDEGEGSHLTISTEWTPAGGLSGRLERRFAPGALHKVYVEELGLVADYATALASSSAPLIVTSAPEPGRTPSAA
jgi:hypothetical protein